MQKSLLLISLLYICIGLLNLISAGISAIFYLSIIAGAVAALATLVRIFRYPQKASVYSLFTLSVLSGYMLGPIVAVIYYFTLHRYSPQLLVGQFAFVGYNNTISYALASAYVVAGLLNLADSISKPVFRSSLNSQHIIHDLSDKLFLLIMSFIVFAALFAGDFGYLGTVPNSQDQITVLGGLAGLILPALIPLLSYVLTKQYMNSRLSWIYVVLIILLALILIITGRRELLFVAIITIIYIAYAAPGIRRVFFIRKVLMNPRRLLAIMAIGTFVFLGFYGFYSIRVAKNQLGYNRQLSIDITQAARIIGNGRRSFYSSASDEAMARPGTLIGYLGSLQGSSIKRYLYGQCVLYGIIDSIPSVILSNKRSILRQYPCTDAYINARFNLPQIDSPTTLLTIGYVDYGVAGMLLYPIIFAALLSNFLGLIRRVRWQLFNLLCIAAVLFASIFVEQDIIFYFVTIRNIIIILFLYISMRAMIRLISSNSSAIFHTNRH